MDGDGLHPESQNHERALPLKDRRPHNLGGPGTPGASGTHSWELPAALGEGRGRGEQKLRSQGPSSALMQSPVIDQLRLVHSPHYTSRAPPLMFEVGSFTLKLPDSGAAHVRAGRSSPQHPSV